MTSTIRQLHKVNVAVCGKFHLFNYIPMLLAAGKLNRFYYSARRGAAVRYGVDDARLVNAPLKEYLIQGHHRLLGDRLYDAAIPAYATLWSRAVLGRWSPAPLLHFVAQGACLPLIAQARRDGSAIICEVVNTHPEYRRELMQREAEHWGLSPYRDGLLAREKSILDEVAQADYLLAPSGIVVDSFRRHGVHTPALRLPYSANIAQFRPITDRERGDGGAFRIICVGRLGLRKGQLYLLKALETLNLPKVELTLIGSIDPAVRDQFAYFAHRFAHIDRVPHPEMPAMLARHDLAIMPSIEEGLAVSICEAMAAGLPVIATEESGAAELLRDGVSGLLVPARNAEAIAQAIFRLYQHRDEARAMGQAAADDTRSLINWERYAKDLISFYDMAISATAERMAVA